MSLLVKYIVITHGARKGTYPKETHEVVLDARLEDFDGDLGAIGLYLHNDTFGSRDKRHFVKVLGAEPQDVSDSEVG